jgi:hypothetical protein
MIPMQPGKCSQQAIPPILITLDLILGSSLVVVQERIIKDLYA